jgi:hypothetical protein
MKRLVPPRFRAGDILITLLGTVLVVSLYIHQWGRQPGEPVYARVQHGDHAPMLVSLRENTQLTVPGRLGPSTLQVRDGRIRFVD